MLDRENLGDYVTIFELVKLALDELYEEGRQEHGSELDLIIKTRMVYLTKCYRDLTSGVREPIDYRYLLIPLAPSGWLIGAKSG